MALLLRIRTCAAAFEGALWSPLSPVRLPPPLHPLAELKSVVASGSPPLRLPRRQPCSFSETTARSRSPPPPLLQHECSSALAGSLQRPSPAPLQPCVSSVTAERSHSPPPPLLRHEFSSSSAVGSAAAVGLFSPGVRPEQDGGLSSTVAAFAAPAVFPDSAEDTVDGGTAFFTVAAASLVESRSKRILQLTGKLDARLRHPSQPATVVAFKVAFFA